MEQSCVMPIQEPQALVQRKNKVGECCLKQDIVGAAKAVKRYFDDLMAFAIKEANHFHVDSFRCRINSFVKNESRRLNETLEVHLAEIEKFPGCPPIINYLLRKDFIGYINYGLLEVLQLEAEDGMLVKWVEEYKKDFQCFVKSFSLKDLCSFLMEDLRIAYPVGLPHFKVHLESEWNGKTFYEWDELLGRLASSTWPKSLMICSITEECILIHYCVWPSLADAIMKDLVDPEFISCLRENGAEIRDISLQLQQYKPSFFDDHEMQYISSDSDISTSASLSDALKIEKRMRKTSTIELEAVSLHLKSERLSTSKLQDEIILKDKEIDRLRSHLKTMEESLKLFDKLNEESKEKDQEILELYSKIEMLQGHDHSSDEAEEADPKTEGTQCLSEILKESEHCFNVEAPPEAHAIESTDKTTSSGIGVLNKTNFAEINIGLSMGAPYYFENGVKRGEIYFCRPGPIVCTVYTFPRYQNHSNDIHHGLAGKQNRGVSILPTKTDDTLFSVMKTKLHCEKMFVYTGGLGSWLVIEGGPYMDENGQYQISKITMRKANMKDVLQSGTFTLASHWKYHTSSKNTSLPCTVNCPHCLYNNTTCT